MKYIMLYETFLDDYYIYDKVTNEFIFQKNKLYTPTQFLKICKNSEELKDDYMKINSNVSIGIYAIRYFNEKLNLPLYITVERPNPTDSIEITIKLRGDKGKNFFIFTTPTDTPPQYKFHSVFINTRLLSQRKFIKPNFTYEVIGNDKSTITKILDDIVNVFNDYETINNVPFNIKNAKLMMKEIEKTKSQWEKLIRSKSYKTQLANVINAASNLHSDIIIKEPKFYPNDMELFYKVDEPYDIRHPESDELFSNKLYIKYEIEQSKINSILSEFCRKYNIELTIAAQYSKYS